ncbi:MAG: hypothetical protein ACOZEN_16050 [Thermodesulfobacteriota bacterium]
MRARTLLALAAVLTLILAPAFEASAKRSGSFSSGGSRSGSSGWSSSSKPSTPAPPPGSSSGWSGSSAASKPSTPAPSAPAQSSGTSSGWSNSGGAAAPGAAKSAGTSAFSSSGADAAKRQAATTSYQGYQGLYGKSGNPVKPGQVSTSKPILNQNRSFGSYQDYNRYRDNYYAGRGWSAPGYAFGSFSRFGMWDAMFMWFMLSNLTSGSSFFYNHQNDPGVQAFKQEAAKLSESNADLKKQLDELNAKMDQMKKDGVAPDPNALPKDVDPNVVLAEPRIEEPKNSSSSLMGPVLGMVLIGGAAWMFLGRRRRA